MTRVLKIPGELNRFCRLPLTIETDFALICITENASFRCEFRQKNREPEPLAEVESEIVSQVHDVFQRTYRTLHVCIVEALELTLKNGDKYVLERELRYAWSGLGTPPQDFKQDLLKLGTLIKESQDVPLEVAGRWSEWGQGLRGECGEYPDGPYWT